MPTTPSSRIIAAMLFVHTLLPTFTHADDDCTIECLTTIVAKLQQQISALESTIQAQQKKIQALEYSHPFPQKGGIPKPRRQALERSHPLPKTELVIDSIEQLKGNIKIEGQVDINGNIKLQAGEAVNEFSKDGKLGSNSHQAVPTEQAVKTYIDFVASQLQNQINNVIPSQVQRKIGDAMFNLSAGYFLGTDYTLEKEYISLSREGYYAIYFRLVIPSKKLVTINMSGDFDGYMYLYNRKGQQIAYDDESGGNHNPRIQKELEPGTYLIECTSYAKGMTGIFKVMADN